MYIQSQNIRHPKDILACTQSEVFTSQGRLTEEA